MTDLHGQISTLEDSYARTNIYHRGDMQRQISTLEEDIQGQISTLEDRYARTNIYYRGQIRNDKYLP